MYPMLKPLFYCILSLFLYSHNVARCQDVIVKKNGDTIAAKVVRVNPFSVEFRKPEGTDSSILAINKSYINYIIYKNGVTDTFRVSDIQNGQNDHIYKVDPESHNYKGNYYGSMRLADRGTQDAKKYYKKYKGAKFFTALTAIFIPYNLIPDIIIYHTPPKPQNLGCPYPELMLKQEYSTAYKQKAYQIKRKQMLKGELIGYGIVMSAVSILVIAALSTH